MVTYEDRIKSWYGIVDAILQGKVNADLQQRREIAAEASDILSKALENPEYAEEFIRIEMRRSGDTTKTISHLVSELLVSFEGEQHFYECVDLRERRIRKIKEERYTPAELQAMADSK